jgi:5-hydroxyisourate hydrolase-like protein (transthyretin family)
MGEGVFVRPFNGRGHARRAVPVFALALALAAAPAAALQGARGAVESQERIATGAVVRPHDTDSTMTQPVAGVWATLHRVGRDTAGVVDSSRTDARGRYSIPYLRRQADTAAVYFVTAEHGGVTYFSAAMPAGEPASAADTIVVFDTTAGPAELRILGRHLVIGERDSTDRHLVVEVFELENDGRRTVVAPDEGSYTWSTRIPLGAQDVVAGQGDVSAEALVVEQGVVKVIAPIAPGTKQVAFSYTLGRGDFPLSIPLTEPVEFLEVLAEPQQAVVQGARLAEVERASVEGRVVRRWLADSVDAGSVVHIELPPIALDRRSLYVAGVLLSIGIVMLLSLTRSFKRRAPHVNLPGMPDLEPPETIARRIVDLDTRFQRRKSPTDAERAHYEDQRAELKDRLNEALARRDGL